MASFRPISANSSTPSPIALDTPEAVAWQSKKIKALMEENESLKQQIEGISEQWMSYVRYLEMQMGQQAYQIACLANRVRELSSPPSFSPPPPAVFSPRAQPNQPFHRRSPNSQVSSPQQQKIFNRVVGSERMCNSLSPHSTSPTDLTTQLAVKNSPNWDEAVKRMADVPDLVAEEMAKRMAEAALN